MTKPIVLAAQQLSKRYKTRQVVGGVDLQIRSGEIVGLLGPNGAGKTTSFYMMVGLVAADTGRVIYADQDITHLPMHARARLGIGYLPQEASVFRKLSVKENILAILQTRKDLSTQTRKLRLEQLFDELQIGHVQDTLGISLSGGERRRVEIARALATEPRFILLDEPFAGVDPISVLDIQSIIHQLTERHIGVLFTDHNVQETLRICNRAYILNSGAVIAEGNPETILNNQQVKDVYLGENFQLTP